ncbi:hypothetical protein Q1695_007386 [Nippostrongylus brasiliensis]|nr:hypothetical protein Q1695_007386 [Nippostrongylus brasiliensis]
MIRSCVILLLISICATNSYKFLVYSPIFGYSHTNFMGVIADTLTEAGHDVTVLMPIVDMDQESKTGVKLTKRVIKIPAQGKVIEAMKGKDKIFNRMWTMAPTLSELMKVAGNMSLSFAYTCEGVVSDEELLKQLADEKFDVGIAEPFHMCGFGIFELLKIRATVASLSTVHKDVVSSSIGEPVVPSYVPGLMATMGDRMSFIDRVKSVVDVVLGQQFYTKTFEQELSVLRAKFNPQFKGYKELLAEASFVLTNSNPYLDYSRPMLHKTVPIGGITVNIDPKKNILSKEWDKILKERNRTVLVSFGSMAKSIWMPEEYKQTLVKVFESMPDTTFIWKYEEEGSQLAAHLKNVYLSTWVPQVALLADSRLSAFVTHGGLGSVTELAHMGKPAILIPIFGDQTRNARMLVKHGGGIVLTKFDLETPTALRDSLNIILKDASYASNAKRLSEMLVSRPISSKSLLVSHCEFAAKFGRLPNLDPYGRHLSFMEYFLIDIAVVSIGILALAAFVVVMVIPIYGDQTRNARMLAKHGGGIVLTKFDLETPTALRDSLNIILKDASYASNAKRLSEMLVGRPISSKSLLISHCEFAAKFGRLPNLDPFGRHLSYMEYFLIDIAIVSIGILALAAFVVVIVVRKCLSFTVKRKKD